MSDPRCNPSLGQDQGPPPLPLRAGPLTMLFEPQSAFLRYIRLGDHEVLRGIYAAVRDRNWITIAPRVHNLHIQSQKRSFELIFDAECKQAEIDFLWKGRILGQADGTLRFDFDGLARSTFLRNRIGFCILHPIRHVAGSKCFIEHADGAREQETFPQFVSPHQPFVNLRCIEHEVRPGVRASVRMEGDIFEMEDQRNWTDGSYKTYCTPLALPFPAEIKEGTRIQQSVTLSLTGTTSQAAPAGKTPITITADPRTQLHLPRIGLGMASHGQPLSDREIQRLKSLHLSHLRVDLKLAEDNWRDLLCHASHQATALGVQLETAIFLSSNAVNELADLSRECGRIAAPIGSWLVFHVNERSTTEKWIRLARRHLSRSKARIGAGANMYFTELNRGRPPIELLDFACFSTNPQVHLNDNSTLVESLEAQAHTVQSARQFCGQKPIAVTPVTLKKRFNADATGPEPPPPSGQLPPQVDVRQLSLFAAAWTAASIKYLAESGAASATYYETTGWRGVMETESRSPMPDLFPSTPGSVFPLYHVLADIGEFSAANVIPCISSDPLRAEAMLLQQPGRQRLLLMNFTPDVQRIQLTGLRLPGPITIKCLDASTVEHATLHPEPWRTQAADTLPTKSEEPLELDLPPHAVVRLDTTSPDSHTTTPR